ncbi:Hsp70 family protein [Candidatus Laterigemmans baculatus]|uniref:Hsp70 family protein n=1 Tax=Candidatus Laterigemmans baculatus TaxID=2770505 RepID=UPI0013DD1CF7|nr:Hsp70 family protein [Candidatus Laterigemmans baculatus]
MEPILGIDLGTTNSVVAVLENGKPRVIANPENGERILPSVVGIDPAGELLVGTAALNQAVLYPERTIRSIKRQMGREIEVPLGESRLSPPEVSAIILRTLARWAEADLGRPVTKAVITVPAFFNDSQREATRQAGRLAGLDVVRIVNEPTAASLVYEPNCEQQQRILVYDLGGGTFDVSIVSLEGGVVEVLASHGDTHLGGDDFDQLLRSELVDRLEGSESGRGAAPLDLRGDVATAARLLRAAEEAKKRLSFETFTAVREEFLKSGDRDLHLETELERSDFEELIEPSLERTIQCVDRALEDARMHAGQLDRVILVGGSTRIPAVSQLLAARLEQQPSAEIDPDLCVALGAAVQGGLIAGEQVGRVLVDITPHTLGIRVLDSHDPMRSTTIFAPIIPRRTPLPAIRSETFQTAYDGQEAVEVEVFQGESREVERNQRIGSLMLEDLSPHAPEGSPISVRFTVNLNGIVEVRAVDRVTGQQAAARLQRGTETAADSDPAAQHRASQERLGNLLGESLLAAAGVSATEGQAQSEPSELAQAANQADVNQQEGGEPDERPAIGELRTLRAKVERVRGQASEADVQEMDLLLTKLREAADAEHEEEFKNLAAQLDDLLFYLDEA